MENIKERSVNFNKEEIERLQALIERYKNILMCKKTDGTSSKRKDQAWRNIEKEFNAIGQTPRSVKQLKYKFENLKKSAKKEATKERQELIRTGGGRPPTLPPAAEDATDWLRSIMSGSIDGNEALYDDDVITQNSDVVQVDNNAIIDIEFEEPTSLKKDTDVDLTESDQMTQLEGFDSSTPHSSLKKPMAPPLRRQIKKKQVNNNILKQTLQQHKINVLRDLNNLETEKMKINLNHQQELHEQILRHNEEKHKLEMLKLDLEIQILKARK